MYIDYTTRLGEIFGLESRSQRPLHQSPQQVAGEKCSHLVAGLEEGGPHLPPQLLQDHLLMKTYVSWVCR